MSNDLPSFEKAQYAFSPATAPDQCTRCQQPIAGSYYRINGSLACEPCAAQATPNLPTDSHAAYVRAILYGIGAAIIGMILYALFEIVTGIIIGYLAIGVGFLVGKAMKYGSKGRGGRRYQITAALLTYFSVSMAAVPVAIHQYTSEKPAQTVSAPGNTTADNSNTSTESKSGSTGLGPALLALAGFGIASPFLELGDGFGGIIGLFILFIGIRFAWNFTAGNDYATDDISGPFSTQPASS